MGRTEGMRGAEMTLNGTDQRRHVSREGIVVVAGGRPGLSEEEETGFQDLVTHTDRSRRTGLQINEQRSKESSSNDKRKGERGPVQ